MISINKRKLPLNILKRLSSLKNPFTIHLQNECPSTDINKGVIFAVNHSNSFDIPICLNVLDRYPIVLLAKQQLKIADRFFFFLSGTLWVDRNNPKDTKQKAIKLLQNNNAILWFPEGTWNLSENLLMLPMKWGIIEVAQMANVPIIPVSLEYNRDLMKCEVDFGFPINVTNTGVVDGIRFLRDEMAALKFYQIERKGLFYRSTIDIKKERDQVLKAITEYMSLEWYEEERKHIFKNY